MKSKSLSLEVIRRFGSNFGDRSTLQTPGIEQLQSPHSDLDLHRFDRNRFLALIYE
jgi:hypothetical protein